MKYTLRFEYNDGSLKNVNCLEHNKLNSLINQVVNQDVKWLNTGSGEVIHTRNVRSFRWFETPEM